MQDASPGVHGTSPLAYWRYTNTGSVIMLPEKTLLLIESVTPTVISSGAVSPITRAMAIITPVVMPGTAVRSTTLTMVSHLGTPSA